MTLPLYLRALYGWLAWKGAQSNKRYLAWQRKLANG